MVLLTIPEVAQALDLSPARIYMFVRENRLKTATVLGRLGVTEKELDRFRQLERPRGRPANQKKSVASSA